MNYQYKVLKQTGILILMVLFFMPMAHASELTMTPDEAQKYSSFLLAANLNLESQRFQISNLEVAEANQKHIANLIGKQRRYIAAWEDGNDNAFEQIRKETNELVKAKVKGLAFKMLGNISKLKDVVAKMKNGPKKDKMLQFLAKKKVKKLLDNMETNSADAEEMLGNAELLEEAIGEDFGVFDAMKEAVKFIPGVGDVVSALDDLATTVDLAVGVAGVEMNKAAIKELKQQVENNEIIFEKDEAALARLRLELTLAELAAQALVEHLGTIREVNGRAAIIDEIQRTIKLLRLAGTKDELQKALLLQQKLKRWLRPDEDHDEDHAEDGAEVKPEDKTEVSPPPPTKIPSGSKFADYLETNDNLNWSVDYSKVPFHGAVSLDPNAGAEGGPSTWIGGNNTPSNKVPNNPFIWPGNNTPGNGDTNDPVIIENHDSSCPTGTHKSCDPNNPTNCSCI
jgi:hypothetical protein